MVELFFPEMIESSHIIALVVIINILIFSVLGYVVGIHNLAYRKLGIKNPHYTKP